MAEERTNKPPLDRSEDELIRSFPSALHDEIRTALSILPENRHASQGNLFSVRLGEDLLSIPYRIYFDPPILQTLRLTSLQSELLDCLFTRHSDGFVRQKCLERIIHLRDIWVPCFVVPLVGEYVIEILRVIQENLASLDRLAYAEFFRANPEFMGLTEKRVISYWNCYYRSIPRREYPGFMILSFLQSMAENSYE